MKKSLAGSLRSPDASRRKTRATNPETWQKFRMVRWLSQHGWEVTAQWPSGRIRLVLVLDGVPHTWESKDGLRAAVKAIRESM